jgi:hypothetical protein
MITLHVTAKMIAAGTRTLYGHAKADPERTVIEIFIAMMQARSEMPEIEVQMQADEHRRRH